MIWWEGVHLHEEVKDTWPDCGRQGLLETKRLKAWAGQGVEIIHEVIDLWRGQGLVETKRLQAWAGQAIKLVH